jgi:dihydroorotate dehydrogenase (fumarate)
VPLLPALTRSLRRLVAAVLVALVLAGVLVAASAATPARADDTDGISGSPATDSSADGRSRFSYQVAPGQQLTDDYIVRNTGTTPQVMKVFATDAYNTEDGSYGLLDTDAPASGAGSWVSFDQGAKQIDIPLDPGASQVVPFTVNVPADAGPGDHAAGIVISVTSAEGQILVDRRVATRLYIRVPGDLQPRLTISSIAADYQGQVNPFDGSSAITFTVKNDGNVALGASMVAGVNTWFGIGTGAQSRQDLSEMLPGSTRTITMTVPGTGQWGYLNPYVSLQPTVDPDALNPGPLPQVNRDTVTFAVPWLLLIAVVIAAGVYLFIRIRRARDEKTARDWIAYTEAEARRKARDDAEPVTSNEPR